MEMQEFKDLLTSLRELILIGVFILIFAKPDWVRSTMESAGIKSANVLGVELETIQESQETLEHADQIIAQLKDELNAISSAVNAVQNQNISANTRTEIKQLEAQIDSSSSKIGTVQRTLKTDIRKHQQILDRNQLQSSPALQNSVLERGQ